MDQNDILVESLSLTHVHYNPNDPVSYACAWLALVPQGLCVAYAALLWATREAELALLLAGQMASEALNVALKHSIREERPNGSFGKGYGMPSSHAQFITFFSVSISMFLLLRHRPNNADTDSNNNNSNNSNNKHGNRAATTTPSSSYVHPASSSSPSASSWQARAALSALALAGAVAVGASRVYLQYHTPKQVLAGAGAGAACALAWFAATDRLRAAGGVDWLLDTRLARAFRFRDLLLEEDPVQAGWEKWQRKRATTATTTKTTTGLKEPLRNSGSASSSSSSNTGGGSGSGDSNSSTKLGTSQRK